MSIKIYNSIKEQMDKVSYRRHQLIIICGDSGCKVLEEFSMAEDLPYINLSLELSKALLEVPVRKRARKIEYLVNQIINQVNSSVICFDHLEILFVPELQQDPLRLLENVSRNTTIIAGWNGSFENGILKYAEHGHPEFRLYSELDASVLTLK